MESIRHLVEVLKSQVSLYSELSDLMVLEKQAVSAWAVDKTVKITKQKDDLLRREAVLQEARRLLLEKIAESRGEESATFYGAVKYAAGSVYEDDLKALCEKLAELVTGIHAENIALRMLYATNMRLINDFFTQAGLSVSSAAGYSPGGSAAPKISTMVKIG